jgi:hypothetical protein
MLAILMLVLFVALFAFWLYGLVLSLRASLILTLVCFLVHVPFIVFGLLKWAFGVDLPREIVDALRRR